MKTLTACVLVGAAWTSTAVAGPRNADKASLVVTSTAFAANEMIPSDYTCDGANRSLPVSWTKPPAGTKSVAVMLEDPDAPGGAFLYWLVTGISPAMTSLPAGATLPDAARRYTGPCPPSGKHHYVVTVYALDLPPGKPVTKAELTGDHVLAEGELIGVYQKQK